MDLRHLVQDYRISKGISDSSCEYYLRCVKQLERFTGSPPDTSDLSRDRINFWLHHKHGAAAYRKSLRTGIMAIWSFAASRGYCDPPNGIASVRLRTNPVNSWSQQEVSRLRQCAIRQPGVFRDTTIPRGRYFGTLISAAWYLGLSACDLHRLTMPDFDRGNLVFNRQKTGQRIAVAIPQDEWQSVVIFVELSGNQGGPIWPLWGSREAFRKAFRPIVNAAGLVGPWKTLRASAGTAYEIAHPGQGHIFLGNTRDVFMKNYYDPRREPNALPHAPRLMG